MSSAGEAGGGGYCASGGDYSGGGNIDINAVPDSGQAPTAEGAAEEATPRRFSVENGTAASGSDPPRLVFLGHVMALHVDVPPLPTSPAGRQADVFWQAMQAAQYTPRQEERGNDGSGT